MMRIEEMGIMKSLLIHELSSTGLPQECLKMPNYTSILDRALKPKKCPSPVTFQV